MAGEADYAEDEKWLVVRGRRWRRTDPELPEPIVEDLKSHLGRARNEVKAARKADDSAELRRARDRVDLAKRGLGERGERWWELPLDARLTRAEEALTELSR